MYYRKQPAFLFGILLVIIVLTGCGTNNATQQETTNLTPIRIATNVWPGFGLVYIADAKGLFQQEHVAVQLVSYSILDEANADFATRKVDGTLEILSDAIAQSAAGIPLQVVWTTDSSTGGDVLVGNNTINDVEDLKGKRVGVTYGSFSQVFAVSLLTNHGLTQNDITIVNMPGEQVPDALAKGEIDAGHTWDPYTQEAIAAGGHIVTSSQETPGVIADVLAFQSHVIENRPDDIRAIIRALTNARAWWDANPQEGNQIVATELGVNVEDLPALLAGVKIYTLQDNLTAFNPDTQGTQSLYETGRISIDVLRNAQVIDQAPDLNSIFNPSFVQALTGN